MTKHALLETPDRVRRHDVDGGRIAVRLRAEGTDGTLGAVEMTIPAGFAGLPLHVHPAFDELFFMLGGELAFRVGDESVSAVPGTLVYAPGDVPHTFAEVRGEPARVLLVCTPGGHERYFEAMAAALGGDGAATPEFFRALMAEHGIRPVG